jgi:hypothetical protein
MRFTALVLILAGCVSAPPDAVRIEVHAENGEARVVSIDGRRVLAAAAVHVPPGRHALVVFCRYNLGIMSGDAQSLERAIAVDLEAGVEYRVEARMAPAPCTLRLVREER